MKEISKGIVKLSSKEDTEKLGHKIAEALEPGDIVALMGQLGAGKTELTKAIAAGLGVKEKVISPTFTIVKLYESGRIPMAHFDVYRLDGSDDLFDAGASDIIGGKYVSVIEWADIVADMLPADALLIHLTYGEGEYDRIAEIL